MGAPQHLLRRAADEHRMTIRRRLYFQLEPLAWPGQGVSPLNRLLVAAILLATAGSILQTEPLIAAGREPWFRLAELGFGALFLAEYAGRLWTSAENPAFADGVRGRLRYAMTPGALLDLAVVLVTFAPFVVANALLLRLLRLLSIIRFARLGRLSAAMRHLTEALRERRYELSLTAFLAAFVMTFGAAALWWAEGEVQPDKFGSIPRAMWWATVTLTTIGYGDVYPVTVLGKVFAGLVAVAGIGLIALPTGILAAAFSDALQRDRRRERPDC
jgi:voltage-gated potassium channel